MLRSLSKGKRNLGSRKNSTRKGRTSKLKVRVRIRNKKNDKQSGPTPPWESAGILADVFEAGNRSYGYRHAIGKPTLVGVTCADIIAYLREIESAIGTLSHSEAKWFTKFTEELWIARGYQLSPDGSVWPAHSCAEG